MPDAIRQQIKEKEQQVLELYQQGRYGQAMPIAIQVYDLTRHALGESHLDFSHSSLDTLASHFRKMGHYAAAESLLRQALEVTHRGR